MMIMCMSPLAAGPKWWNSLPVNLRQNDINYEQLKQLLITFSCRCWECGAQRSNN